MREDICTIPISEVFEPKEGCPICRMRDTLENRVTEYITGAAMMEPDIREVTNVQGFCYPHFSMMLKKGSRLSNALILESHLKEIETSVLRLDKRGVPGKKGGRGREEADGKLLCLRADPVGDGSHVRYHLPLVGKGRRIPGAVFPAALFVFAPLYRLAGGGAEGRRQEKLRRVCSGGQRFGEKLFGWPSKGRHPLLFYVRLPKYRRGFWKF